MNPRSAIHSASDAGSQPAQVRSRANAGRTVVVGLGRTGLSCARWLRARGEEFAVTDSRIAPPEAAALAQMAPDVQSRLGGFDLSLLDGAAQIVASPGVALAEPFLREAARRGLPIVGDIELFARAAQARVVAITGTNGKSTVTSMVAHMAAAAGARVLAGGNLGRPALDLLEEPTPDLYVLELSSFQLETTHTLQAAAAAVLNVTADHMDRYASLDEYANAKSRIFRGCGAAVLNFDDPAVRRMSSGAGRVLGFSLRSDGAAHYTVGRRSEELVLMAGSDALVGMSELKVSGLHNAANALAALALCDALGLVRERCVEGLRSFSGLAHRSQWVADVNGVRYVDDSKGTNVGATLAAVAGMSGPLVLIAGGQGKGQDFAPLASALQGKVRHVVLIGQDARLLHAALEGVATTQFARDMQEAVRLAAQAAREGETVLLSPACASLDMFRDYAHRGDEFAAAVRGLAT